MNLEMTVRFGKYKGKTIRWIQTNDRRYFEWAKANAPGMFKAPEVPVKPVSKPASSVTTEEDESSDSGWISGRAFYEMAMAYHRSKGEDV
jgi:hypothetical protein